MRASRIGWVAPKEDRVAKSGSRGGGTPKKGSSPAAGWAKLTWDDLERWAGSRSASRGRTYQRGGRVKDLRISSDGDLLATVVGGDRYATTVALSAGPKRLSLESACTCPVGINCKHAGAAVAECLQSVAGGRELPAATEDDPRWAKLESDGAEVDDDWDEEEDDASWDDDDADEFPVKKTSHPKRPARWGGTP